MRQFAKKQHNRVMCSLACVMVCLVFAAAAFGQNQGKGGGKGGGGKESPPADPAIAVRGLTVMNDDGSNKTEVFSEEGKFSAQPRMPSWSPGGDSIAFNRNKGAGRVFELWRIDIAVVDGVPQGSNLTKLLGFALHPAWSPLGNEIAFAEGRTANLPSSLFAIPANGGTPVELYAAPGGHVVFWPAWSPDGMRLAFVEMELDEQRLHSIKSSIKILDVASGAVVTTVFAVGAEYEIKFLDWARTQDKLAFDLTPVFTVGQPRVVFTLDITTGELVPVAEGLAPTWSPDDTRLAYNDSTGKVSTVDLATGDITKLTKGGRGAALWPDWRRF